MSEVTKILKSVSARMEKIKLEGNQIYRNPKILRLGIVLKDQLIPLRSSKEIIEIGIEMIRKSKLLSKITWLLMKMKRKKISILRSIALEIPLCPLI
jgi:hypothetical protein